MSEQEWESFLNEVSPMFNKDLEKSISRIRDAEKKAYFIESRRLKQRYGPLYSYLFAGKASGTFNLDHQKPGRKRQVYISAKKRAIIIEHYQLTKKTVSYCCADYRRYLNQTGSINTALERLRK